MRTFKDFKEEIAETYGNGTDASYDTLKSVKGGDVVIDEYIDEMLGDYHAFNDAIKGKAAIFKANFVHLITSDYRGEVVYNKLSFVDDLEDFFEEIFAYFDCDINFEWLVSYIMHLDIDCDEIKELFSDLNDEQTREVLYNIEDSIFNDIKEKLIVLDEYKNAHDKEEYLYYNEKED